MKRISKLLAIAGSVGIIGAGLPGGVHALGNCPFEGTWVGTFTDPAGEQRHLVQTFIPDNSGHTWQVVAGAADTGIGGLGAVFPGATYSPSDVRGEGVRTGRNSAHFRALAYGIDSTTPDPNILFIRVDEGTAAFTESCDNLEIVTTIAIYLPESDGDDDGLPDADQDPLFTSTLDSVAKRFTAGN